MSDGGGVDRVRVELGERGYDILVGEDLIESAGRHLASVAGRRRVPVVTDARVHELHFDTVARGLADAGFEAEAIVVPEGERAKSFEELGRVVDRLLDMRVDRGSVLVAFGGGVVGDLAGFAAAVVLRGIDFVQIPTTLLAQVDSSVGGKTAVNTRHGKNLVGAFHQPRLVLADTGVLRSLPRRELLAGYAEVAKYGLIDRPAFFDWLAEGAAAALLGGDAVALRRAVAESCRTKADVVAADERESGRRALLNLGHTFGHALEAEAGYEGALLHGEAVAIGMVMAFDLSVRLGLCPAGDAERVRRHLGDVGLPTRPTTGNAGPFDPDRLLDRMRQDKKASDGRLTLILVEGIGRAFIANDVDDAVVRALWRETLTP